MKTVAIIPAKGTSVRLPGKNLRLMLGKPLVAWAIETAQASTRIDHVIVSTDDEEIRTLAESYGVYAPSSIPTTTGTIEDVMNRATTWLETEKGIRADALVLLLPTNPLRRAHDLDAMIEQFEQTEVDCVASVCEAQATHNPYWIFMRAPDGQVITSTGHILKEMPRYSQDLPRCYIRNDIGFVLKPNNLKDGGVLWGERMDLYPMEELFDTDINTEEDWHVTEDKLRRLQASRDEV